MMFDYFFNRNNYGSFLNYQDPFSSRYSDFSYLINNFNDLINRNRFTAPLVNIAPPSLITNNNSNNNTPTPTNKPTSTNTQKNFLWNILKNRNNDTSIGVNNKLLSGFLRFRNNTQPDLLKAILRKFNAT
jgi:hypothetical protein